jgi:hypothetical protein
MVASAAAAGGGDAFATGGDDGNRCRGTLSVPLDLDAGTSNTLSENSGDDSNTGACGAIDSFVMDGGSSFREFVVISVVVRSAMRGMMEGMLGMVVAAIRSTAHHFDGSESAGGNGDACTREWYKTRHARAVQIVRMALGEMHAHT